MSERLFQAIALAALGTLAVLGIGRALVLASRGISVLPIDRERPLGEALLDLAFVLGFGVWSWETLACALPLDLNPLPGSPRPEPALAPLRAPGALVAFAGLAVYGLALHAFGTSWRLGIDRERAGPLVTRGIFARSRNPVYLGLALLTLGVSLALARPALLLLACAFPVYFRTLVAREERFLAAHYGAAYRAYTARVGRWWSW